MQGRLEFDKTCARGRRRESELAPRCRQSTKVCRFNKKPDVAEVVHDISVFFENDSNGIPIIKWHRAPHNASHHQRSPEISTMSITASPLFTPTAVAGHPLAHRVVMAPMTRSRSTQPGDVPNAINARYYAQRASAALIVTEATQISPQGKGYSFTPGIYSPEQVAGWRLVTDAVHSAGGRIFLQLWHVGRMSHPDFHNGELPVAPSAPPFEGKIWKVDPATGIGDMVDCPTPRALTVDEIKGVIADFRRGARNAIKAGFDGVEIHGANGYLVDQFLRTTSNIRDDEYGGSRKNRLRFLEEVVAAVAQEVGAERTAIRLAPFLTARGMACPDILPTILEATEYLQGMKIAYLHLVEADWDDAPQFTESFRMDI